LSGIAQLELPVAHAEGKFVARDETVLRQMDAGGQLVLRYRGLESGDRELDNPQAPGPQPPVPYPANPNGAMGNVAGICDATGRVLGLMPHPERFVDPTQHPRWTREAARDAGEGLRVFQNALRYCL
jgi:phosphoribosylformylglycinamidine synthase